MRQTVFNNWIFDNAQGSSRWREGLKVAVNNPFFYLSIVSLVRLGIFLINLLFPKHSEKYEIDIYDKWSSINVFDY